MKKVSAFLVLVGVMALAACGSTGGGDSGDGCGDGCGGGGGMDMTETMMDNYLNGTQKAMYWVQMHRDVQVGQYWETSYEMAGVGTTTNRWQVASVDGDTAIVENQNKMVGEYSSYNYVLAYEVDLSAEENQPNVNKAWIGAVGEAPTEIEVMDVPDATCGGEAGEVEMTEEDFEVDMAGGTWTGTLRTVTAGGGETKTWIADNGWFGGMIKMETASFTQELTAWGDDAEALLAWS